MAEAYIIDACRTAVGKRGGSLADVHPADLGAHIIKGVVERSGVDPDTVDDVIFGCIDQIGPQGGDIARTAWLAAGYSEDVPGVTIDRQCGSSQQAVHFAAQAVMSGTMDVVIAGGVQNMSLIPIATASKIGKDLGLPHAFHGSKGWVKRYNTESISQFRGAELICDKWNISREDMEAFALESHTRARRAQAEGRFDREIVPFGDFKVDESPRDTTLEKMASLPLLPNAKYLTAAVSSPTNDAASAMLIANEAAVKRNGWTPRARIHFLGVRGADPVFMLTAPINATFYAMEKTGMSLDDIDLVEINEAFAPVVLAWQKETGADLSCVNVNGGAIALGHPIGATGTRLMTTLLHELERTGGRYGLQTMCEGGGQANVTIIERL